MRWISINDNKLKPKNKKQLLFCCNSKSGERHIIMGYLSDKGWDFYFPDGLFQVDGGKLDITHWKELPRIP